VRLLESTDELWFILAGNEDFAGLVVPTKEGGFMYVLTDKGDPQESLTHEIEEAFTIEIQRLINEEGG